MMGMLFGIPRFLQRFLKVKKDSMVTPGIVMNMTLTSSG